MARYKRFVVIIMNKEHGVMTACPAEQAILLQLDGNATVQDALRVVQEGKYHRFGQGRLDLRITQEQYAKHEAHWREMDEPGYFEREMVERRKIKRSSRVVRADQRWYHENEREDRLDKIAEFIGQHSRSGDPNGDCISWLLKLDLPVKGLTVAEVIRLWNGIDRGEA